MRLLDLELAMGDRLERLPYPVYLCAMCVIAMELQAAYAGVLPGEGVALAEQTVSVVQAAYRGDGDVAAEAARIAPRWLDLMDDPETDGPVGLFSAFETFHLLTLEVAGETRQKTAIAQVTNAATGVPDARLPPEPPGPRLVKLDYGEQADEGSPGVRMLRKFEEVASLAARQHATGLTCDPAQLHAVIFG